MTGGTRAHGSQQMARVFLNMYLKNIGYAYEALKTCVIRWMHLLKFHLKGGRGINYETVA